MAQSTALRSAIKSAIRSGLISNDNGDSIPGTKFVPVPFWLNNIWDYRSEFELYEQLDGTFIDTFDPNAARPVISTSLRAWVDPVSGNDGTAALNNINLPYKSLSAAYTAGARWFVAKGGNYNRATGFATSFNPNSDIILDSWDGGMVLINKAYDAPIWTLETGSTYSTTTASGLTMVVDRDYVKDGIVNASGAQYMVDGTTLTPHGMRRTTHVESTTAVPSGTVNAGLVGTISIKSSTNAGAATDIVISGSSTRTTVLAALNAVANIVAEIVFRTTATGYLAISTTDGGNLVINETVGTPLTYLGITGGTITMASAVDAGTARYGFDGVKTYVRTFDNRAPDADVLAD